jgi:hypothetical protein
MAKERTMKRIGTTVLAGLVLAMAGGAWAQDVKIDYDKAANFGAIKTFSVKLGTSWGNPIGEKRVTDQVTGALVGKGWTLAPEDKADAQVVLHGASQTKHSLNTYYSGMGGYRWGGMGTATTTDTQYTVGTLLGHLRREGEEPDLARHRAGRGVEQDRKEHQEGDKGDREALQGLPPR